MALAVLVWACSPVSVSNMAMSLQFYLTPHHNAVIQDFPTLQTYDGNSRFFLWVDSRNKAGACTYLIDKCSVLPGDTTLHCQYKLTLRSLHFFVAKQSPHIQDPHSQRNALWKESLFFDTNVFVRLSLHI